MCPRPEPPRTIECCGPSSITSIALFMAALDNLVVTTALPVIRESFSANLAELEWIVNAYTLTFAVLLLTGAALGDRFGRKRMFVIGLAIFTGGSAIAALSNSVEVLIAARAIQGVGGAIITPLTLTILSAAVPPERRAVALGAWGGDGRAGDRDRPARRWRDRRGPRLAVDLLAQRADRAGRDPARAVHLTETHGPKQRLDLPGLALVTAGLLAVVWGLVHGNELGWTSPRSSARSSSAPSCSPPSSPGRPARPSRCSRSACSARARSARRTSSSLLMYFGMFGSIFLLAQFFQVVQGYSPFAGRSAHAAVDVDADLRRADRRPPVDPDRDAAAARRRAWRLQALALAWLPVISPRPSSTSTLVPAFILAGIGMGLFFAPIANVVLSAVRPEEEGKASGANNAIRELGGVFGVAVLASVFTANGSYLSGDAFVDGLIPALQVGAVAVAVGALAALAIGSRARGTESEAVGQVAGTGLDAATA